MQSLFKVSVLLLLAAVLAAPLAVQVLASEFSPDQRRPDAIDIPRLSQNLDRRVIVAVRPDTIQRLCSKVLP